MELINRKKQIDIVEKSDFKFILDLYDRARVATGILIEKSGEFLAANDMFENLLSDEGLSPKNNSFFEYRMPCESGSYREQIESDKNQKANNFTICLSLQEGHLDREVFRVIRTNVGEQSILVITEVPTNERESDWRLLFHCNRSYTLEYLYRAWIYGINNPLTAIMMATELAIDENDNSVLVNEALSDISSETSKALGIVQKAGVIRELSYEESEQTQVIETTHSIVEILMPLLLRKGISVHFECDEEEVTANIRFSDYFSLLANILENAHFYCENTISINIKSNDNFVILSITDDGPGVPEISIPFISERYTTTRKATSNMGLGLFVSKMNLLNVGGELEVLNTDDDNGLMVVATLPIF